MKTLIVVRHAKSSWSEPGVEDRKRTLNSRGEKDAPEMAGRLRKRGITIDLFLSSTAKRAHATARYFADEYKADKKDIRLEDALYAATADEMYAVIASLHDKHETVAVFGHNPGITDFVNTLSPVHVDNMPTCAIYAVTADTNNWASFKKAAKNFLFFDYPKNPLDK